MHAHTSNAAVNTGCGNVMPGSFTAFGSPKAQSVSPGNIISTGSIRVGYLSLGPIQKTLRFCDISVREKAWRSRAIGVKAT